MIEIVSLHPVDVEFFRGIIGPLVAGGKAAPGEYLRLVQRHHAASFEAARYIRELEHLREESEPPPPPPGSTRWERLRNWMERFDYRPDPLAVLAARRFQKELHLRGRPFLICDDGGVTSTIDAYLATDGPAQAEKIVTDQLAIVDPRLCDVRPENEEGAGSEIDLRNKTLAGLKAIYDLAGAAREGRHWSDDGERRPALDVLQEELPWRGIRLHSRAVPFWVAEKVDGLEAVCRLADVASPECLVPAWSLFAGALETLPGLRETLSSNLDRARDIGGYVSPEDIPDLLRFLKVRGGAIIRAAAREGEAETVDLLLRKIRECARYAQQHGLGYLEASGIAPLADDVLPAYDHV